MRKFSKIIVVAGTLVALTVPSVAMADAPTGNYQASLKADGTASNGSIIGYSSSSSTQNGQFVSDQAMAGPGARAAIVQGYLGH